MQLKYTMAILVGGLLTAVQAFGGNPDRQGEAGAGQLLINPWARSAGLHSMNTANTMGVEAVYLNVAGMSRIQKTQIGLNHTRYLVGADVNLNAFGFVQKLGNGAFGLSMMSMDLGDFDLTTEDTPGGSGATFSPTFFNIGLSYSHLFVNKVSVGVTAKFVNESVTNARASALAIDAGVQYVTGENDNFKFGISLRNVGGRMRFTGEGLSKQLPNPGPTFEYDNTYYERAATYELPSQLNIGMSYDWLLGKVNRLTFVGNFTSNAFSRDQAGAGLEFSVGKNFALRAAYKFEFDAPVGSVQATLDNGLSAGFSISLPVKRDSDTRIALDYGYRNTSVYKGIHNLGFRIDL